MEKKQLYSQNSGQNTITSRTQFVAIIRQMLQNIISGNQEELYILFSLFNLNKFWNT